MNVSINFSDELEADLRSRAAAMGQDVESFCSASGLREARSS